MDEQQLISRITAELRAYREFGINSLQLDHLIPKWKTLTEQESKRFIKDDELDVDVLRNFRRSQVFISDAPSWDLNRVSALNLLHGGRRGIRKMLIECLEVLKKCQYDELLKKYPCHTAGNPYVFNYQGYRYTLRWFKHICFLGLMNRVLGPKLKSGFVALDIGSSYGIFSSLVKREYPESHCVLVDFPEQLILAYYFLGTCFPGCRIAGIREVIEAKEGVSRSFLEQYDFTLIPCQYYERLLGGSLDLVTNFASLGEMKREWFNYYLKAQAFLTAKYLFAVNRVESYPTYDTDLTILDYPVWDQAKRLHFGVSPAFWGYNLCSTRNLFFYRTYPTQPYFEYIGRI
ncbi:MAG: putative sugar O-methyltransferase [Nitrospirae bacterium]|nr:putative sugar O-methyltransferase [Nitrospirota bacterium]